MDIRIDKSSPIPVGKQVKEQLKLLINSGSCKRGDKLPSIKQLAESIGVNKNTIVAVLNDLENEDYIESYRGKGIFVKDAKPAKATEQSLLKKVDSVISEAKNSGINISELINLMSARYLHVDEVDVSKKFVILFMMGISQKLFDINIQKLKESIPQAEIEGLYMGSELTREKLNDCYGRASLIVVPSIIFESVKNILPKNKPFIKTSGNLKRFDGVRRGMDKKSKVAVIGGTQKIAAAIEQMFIDGEILRPKLVLGLAGLEKNRKELKEMDFLICCFTAKDAVEKLKIKEKYIYYIADYIDDGSIARIKLAMDTH